MRKQEARAFTLIELLIVVAIIAILAAIAVPNFLEAQVRAKVARANADMRSIAVGLESYAVDNNKYPNQCVGTVQISWGAAQSKLTTPVAFMTSIPLDPFQLGSDEEGWAGYFWYSDRKSRNAWAGANYNNALWTETNWYEAFGPHYTGYNSSGALQWMLLSYGPDRYDDFSITQPPPVGLGYTYVELWEVYDSTNGTMSHGDVFRWGP